MFHNLEQMVTTDNNPLFSVCLRVAFPHASWLNEQPVVEKSAIIDVELKRSKFTLDGTCVSGNKRVLLSGGPAGYLYFGGPQGGDENKPKKAFT